MSKIKKKKSADQDNNSIDKIVDDIYDENFSDREMIDKKRKAKSQKGAKLESGSMAESGHEATELDFLQANNT